MRVRSELQEEKASPSMTHYLMFSLMTVLGLPLLAGRRRRIVYRSWRRKIAAFDYA